MRFEVKHFKGLGIIIRVYVLPSYIKLCWQGSREV